LSFRSVTSLVRCCTYRSEEGWAIVVTGPNGDEFHERLGGVAVSSDELLHEALTMPTCAEFMARQDPAA
jgi:hypothetical protein